jgi:hypothetical protein
MVPRTKTRFALVALCASMTWWADSTSLSARAAGMSQCESVCDESADCNADCNVDSYPTTCGEYDGGATNGMCIGECGDGYCNGVHEGYYVCPDDCPNECDQGLGYWVEEVSRERIGRKTEGFWNWTCYEYWKVTARDVVCGLPNRDYCEKLEVLDVACEAYSNNLEEFGQTCVEADLECWLGNDCD